MELALFLGGVLLAAVLVWFVVLPKARSAAATGERRRTEARVEEWKRRISALDELAEEKSRLETRLGEERQRNTELGLSLARAEQAAARIPGLEEELARRAREVGQANENAAKAEAALESEREGIARHLATEQRAGVERLEAQRRTTQEARDRIAKLEKELAEARTRASHLESELRQVSSSAAEAEATLATEREAHAVQLATEREAHTRQLAAEHRAREEQIETLGKAEAAGGERIAKLEKELAEVRARASSLDAELLQVSSGAAETEATLATEREAHARQLATERRRHEERLEAEQTGNNARLDELRKLENQVQEVFGALSDKALRESRKDFLRLAEEQFKRHRSSAGDDLEKRQAAITQLVSPLRKRLDQLDQQMGDLESKREGAYQAIREQVQSLKQGQSELREETGRLVTALRRPEARGRWGEIQLRRVLEAAGLVRGQDFVEQSPLPGSEGALRPDVILHLPGDKAIVVDAKTPVDAYLRVVDATDEEKRSRALKSHVRQVRAQVENLASKRYWDALSGTPDIVVMFVPGEAIFSTAMQADPDLFDFAVGKNVLITTPTTFIALAKAIHYGWQQDRAVRKTREIVELGKKVFDRVEKFREHLADLGRALNTAVKRYNAGVGSFDSRLRPATRQLSAMQDIGSVEIVETAVRGLPAESGGDLRDGRETQPRLHESAASGSGTPGAESTGEAPVTSTASREPPGLLPSRTPSSGSGAPASESTPRRRARDSQGPGKALSWDEATLAAVHRFCDATGEEEFRGRDLIRAEFEAIRRDTRATTRQHGTVAFALARLARKGHLKRIATGRYRRPARSG